MLYPGATFAPRRSFVNAKRFFTTSFTSTENPINQGGIWVRGFSEGGSWTDPQTGANSSNTGQIAFGTQVPSSGFTDSIAHLKGFASNHWVEGTSFNAVVGENIEVEHLLHFAITSGNARGYEVDFVVLSGNTIKIDLVRWNGTLGSFTVLNGGVSVVASADASTGTVFRSQILNNVITCTRNGTNLFTYDLQANFVADGSILWSDGQPGMGFWDGSLVNAADRNMFGWSVLTASDV